MKKSLYQVLIEAQEAESVVESASEFFMTLNCRHSAFDRNAEALAPAPS